jgi:hypothetical protein
VLIVPRQPRLDRVYDGEKQISECRIEISAHPILLRVVQIPFVHLYILSNWAMIISYFNPIKKL